MAEGEAEEEAGLGVIGPTVFVVAAWVAFLSLLFAVDRWPRASALVAVCPLTLSVFFLFAVFGRVA